MAMSIVSSQLTNIIRTERGLTIEGTRTSLYDVMDLLQAKYPPKLICDLFHLTEAQINAALSYIQAHQPQFEAEYQEVLQTREEIRQYWEERNQERLAQIAAMPRQPEHAAFFAQIAENTARRRAAELE
jgi:uncharacterized protein (DUF433 family)